MHCYRVRPTGHVAKACGRRASQRRTTRTWQQRGTWTGRGTWQRDLVDVRVRVVHEEVVVLETEVHANLLGEPHQELFDRKHDLVLVLRAVVGLDIDGDLFRRGHDLVQTAEHVGQDRRHDVRAARQNLIHVVQKVAVAMHLTTEVAKTPTNFL